MSCFLKSSRHIVIFNETSQPFDSFSSSADKRQAPLTYHTIPGCVLEGIINTIRIEGEAPLGFEICICPLEGEPGEVK